MVDVEMGEKDRIQLRHLHAALAEPQGAASTGIDQHPCLPVLPNQIAA